MAGGDAEPRCCWVRASRAAVLPTPNMAAGQPQPAPCSTSGPLPSHFRSTPCPASGGGGPGRCGGRAGRGTRPGWAWAPPGWGPPPPPVPGAVCSAPAAGAAARASGTTPAGWRSPAGRMMRTKSKRSGLTSASTGTFPARTATPPYNFCGFKSPLLYEGALPTHPPPSALQVKMHRLPAPWRHQLTAEEAERNARELVAEEERMKRKAEKKKLKKKKQKDRKKREKLGQELKSKKEAELSTSSLSSAAGAEHPQNSNAEEQEGWPDPSRSPCLGGSAASSGEERGGQEAKAEEMEDELDLSCTFVFKARQKAGVRLPAPGKEKPAKTDNAEPGRRAPGKEPKASLPCLPTPQEPKASLPCLPAPQAPEPETVPLDTNVVEQSLIIAGRGNEAAQKGRYAEAVQAFTEAVKLNPREHRLFGNRSYCYEKLQRYEEALRDAQVSLGLQPGWPKGFFRKGKALRGLKRYAEAVSTFEELLRLDGANADAAAQLEACRALLRQNSSRGRRSPGGIPLSPSLLEAGEPPLPPSGEWASGSCWDTGGFVTVGSSRSQARGQSRAVASSQQTLPPTHPARDCYPLWVGNITAKISEKVLHSSFSRFGQIRFIRMLPERRCAFINYTRKKAAEAAYVAMQDAEVEGSRLALQLKHPSHATPVPPAAPRAPWQGGCPPRGAPVAGGSPRLNGSGARPCLGLPALPAPAPGGARDLSCPAREEPGHPLWGAFCWAGGLAAGYPRSPRHRG
ncbi:tetratricopeptide repeat protein 31 isoform X3 [Harpia harpyja]|uniref:tetratricopeptide repeat protein 31 isoform X3 n=1 Tax=Harpia harpyja TaxID=202280 RepID=UPI0022B0A543|nr:tetratricopeptide repeat protein 31 isoform X3 [Harpia harpyja]